MVPVRDLGKRSLLGVLVDVLDYEAAVGRIIDASLEPRPYAATALAVHGVMTGSSDKFHRFRLNNLDMVTPDGQPVKWALNLLHRARLRDRVYGPSLMMRICSAAERENLPIYLYGSTKETLERLATNLQSRFSALPIAGTSPSIFGTTTKQEQELIAESIRASGARIVFVGLGCPRQEIFAYEYRDLLGIPVVAVGAAFDYHAGIRREPALWVQRMGLQWLHRLVQEPGRLWKRYLILNTSYVFLIALQALGIKRRNPLEAEAPREELLPA
jgi:exopolysaccharide biosynthesis WecB/TagA/CpsF family protein